MPRNRSSMSTALEEEVVAPVGVGRAAEAGKLPHRPQAAAVHRLMDAARERIAARLSQPPLQIPRHIFGAVHGFFLDAHRIAPLRSCSRMSAATSYGLRRPSAISSICWARRSGAGV